MAKLNVKVWIEDKGEPVFGDGRARLLREIEDRGSIHAAADALDMSYRHAWDHLHKMEERLGHPLLERHHGGVDGGGSRLTDQARQILKDFTTAREQIKAFVEKYDRSLAKKH